MEGGGAPFLSVSFFCGDLPDTAGGHQVCIDGAPAAEGLPTMHAGGEIHHTIPPGGTSSLESTSSAPVHVLLKLIFKAWDDQKRAEKGCCSESQHSIRRPFHIFRCKQWCIRNWNA